MKHKLIHLISVLLLSSNLLAAYTIEAENHTDIDDAKIDTFVRKLVEAINTDDHHALLALIHPNCRKVIQSNEDVSLFVEFLKNKTVPENNQWKAVPVKKDSYVFKMNRFVVHPTTGLDLFWKKPTGDEPDNIEAISVMLAEHDNRLRFVSYMNDYLKEKIRSSP